MLTALVLGSWFWNLSNKYSRTAQLKLCQRAILPTKGKEVPVCLQGLLKEPWVSALLAEEPHANVYN